MGARSTLTGVYLGSGQPRWPVELAVLEAVPVLQDAFIGAGTGALVARLAIRRLERRHGELPARRVRQIETAWIVGARR